MLSVLLRYTNSDYPFAILELVMHLKEDFEDTKEVIRIRISKTNGQHNGQKKKDKRTNNDLQNIHIKTKDQVTRTPLKSRDELGCSGNVSSFCSTSGTRRVNLITNPMISHMLCPVFVGFVLFNL